MGGAGILEVFLTGAARPFARTLAGHSLEDPMRLKFLMFAAGPALVLAAASLASAPWAEPDPARAPLTVEQGFHQIAEQIAPGIHVLRQAEPFQPAPTGNITVIEQADGLVVVDTGGARGEGDRAVALVRAISSWPVKTVVITHWHNDHPLGLPAFRDAWPGLRVLSTRQTRDDMAVGRLRGLPFRQDDAWDAQRRERLRGYVAEYTANAEKAGLSEEERQGWRDLAVVSGIGVEDDPGSYVIVPDTLFEGRHSLPDADRPAEVVQLGRSNTDGDAMVWLPKQRILIAGDAVVSPIPYGFNVYPADWIAVLERVQAYDYAILVPGHGLPQWDRKYVDQLIASMRDIRAKVAPLAARGLTAEQILAQADLEEQRRIFAGASPWRRYWFEQYWLSPFVDSARREALGERLGPDPVPAPPAA